jgi:hypothetical protein
MQAYFSDDARENALQSGKIAERAFIAAMRFDYPLTTALILAHSYCCVPHSGQNLAFFGICLPQLKQNFVSVAGDSGGGVPPATVGAVAGGGAGGTGVCGAGPPD